MPEIDPVILQLRADVRQYQNQIRAVTTQVESQLGRQEASIVSLERQVRASSGNIAGSLRSIAGAFGAAFSTQQIGSLIDGFTRFQNSLKVAGVAGAGLAKVQENLLDLSSKYGVSLEALGGLFGNATQAGKELGASQGDVLKLTEATAQSLKITGTGAEQAAGAILGLTQALASGTVHAEEFNQINEGGLRPLLQAAANAEKYGGSVAKLRAAVIAGQVSSQEFLQLMLKFSGVLDNQASKATITLSGALEGLSSRLTVYVGQSAAALGITNALASGIQLLADNLDKVAPLIVGVAAAFVGVKAGSIAFDAVTAAMARQLGIDQALAAQIVKGNASYVSRAQLSAAQATAASEAAAAEVAAIEATLAARKADQAAIAQTLALLERQRAESQAAATQQAFNAKLNFGLGQAVTSPIAGRERQDQRSVLNARRALTAANAQVATSETALAAAQARATAATAAETTAVAANTTAKRAGAIATALLSGAASTLAAVLPFIAIAAVTTAIFAYATSAKQATFDSKEFAEQGKELAENLKLVDRYSQSATSSMAAAGNQAASSATQMRAFAGAVGEAAEKLISLAQARKRDAIASLEKNREDARQQAEAARQRFDAATPKFNGRFGYVGGNDPAAKLALQQYTEANRRAKAAEDGIKRLGGTRLDKFVSASEREGGRDVEGDLARVTRDLTVARERGIKTQVDALEAQRFELTQYKKYRKAGLSPEAARDASNKDLSDFRSASAGAAQDRANRKKARKQPKTPKDSFSDVGQFDRDIASLKVDELRSQEQLATDANTQAKYRHQQVEADVEAYRKSLEDRLNSENLTAAQKARIVEQNKALITQKEANAQLEHSLINREVDDRLTSEEVDLTRSRLDAQRDALDTALDMARTEDERRRIQLQILDAEMEAKRIALQQVIDSRNSTDAQKRVATEELGRLPGQRASRAGSITRQTMGPLEAYLDKIPRTTAEIDERVQGYIVEELDSVTKGISDAISSRLGVKDPLLSGLLDLFIEQVLIKPIGEALSAARGKGAGGGLSGLLGSLGSGLSGIFGKKDFASGVGGGDALGLGSIFGSSSSGIVAGDDVLGSLLNKKSPFGRASGGYVAPGQLVRVGESGPELIRMGGRSGTVIPTGRTDAARSRPAGNTYNISVSADHSVTPAGFARSLSDQILAKARQMDAQTASATIRAVPNRLAGYQRDGT